MTIKIMKLTELTYGQVFTIDETPSYPKLRIAGGYVDMRDEIVKKTDDIMFELREMSDDEIAKQFNMDEKDVIDWRLNLITKYENSL